MVGPTYANHVPPHIIACAHAQQPLTHMRIVSMQVLDIEPTECWGREGLYKIHCGFAGDLFFGLVALFGSVSLMVLHLLCTNIQ